MTISRELIQQHHLFQKNIHQEKRLRVLTSAFQTVYSTNAVIQVVAVLCIASQWHVYLLSLPLSSHVQQAVVQEPFTSTIQTMVNVFFMRYVVMIVIQQVHRLVSFHIREYKMSHRVRIMLIIHQLSVA
jgi:hypothetical protein